uniref:hupothetical protein n=1 Tax=Klebsormidium mucosum TaxID=442831 RepID=UPI00286C6C06|nr:hupothetical protein [Klebsormidium mucosum]YP_010932943.1 hupothetical protein [Klebsormidium mucosum]WKT07125.1 hupothetical protein [Klebsormidium mucosum]WKT07126.1 hupothetical protein [Klebsormidium mucosum]
MKNYNKKSNVEEDKTSTSLNSHDILWNYGDRFCNFVSGGVLSLDDFAALFIVGGAVVLCCHFIPIPKRKMTSSDLATLSCHRQAFAPVKSIEKPISSDSVSLLTSKPSTKRQVSTSALKEKGPCSACSIKFKGAQQPPFQIISVMTQTKPLFNIAPAQKVERRFHTKKSLAPQCQAFPNSSELDSAFSFSQKIIEKQFTLPYSTMKIKIIEDPSLVMTFKPAYERLTDINLSYPDQLKILHFTLKKTCSNWRFTSTTSFTKEDRNIFSQETYGLHFLLTHPFARSDSFINRASHSFCSSLAWPQPPYPWPQLKQKYFHLIKSDLALELVDLDTDLGSRASYFLLAGNVRKFAPEYFHRRALEIFKVIDESIELVRKQSKIADKHAILISTDEKLQSIRSQTLVGEFDTKSPHQRPYEQLFCSTTRKERIVSDRELFSLSSLVFEQDLCCNFYSF